MTNCSHCGNIHSGTCPRIKAIEYFPDGSIKRVEYKEDQIFGPYYPPSYPNYLPMPLNPFQPWSPVTTCVAVRHDA